MQKLSQTQRQEARRPNILKKFFNKWLRFAEILGTVQMVIFLSLVYWTLLAIISVPFKLIGDPLLLKRSHRPGWVRRAPVPYDVETMRKQY